MHKRHSPWPVATYMQPQPLHDFTSMQGHMHITKAHAHTPQPIPYHDSNLSCIAGCNLLQSGRPACHTYWYTICRQHSDWPASKCWTSARLHWTWPKGMSMSHHSHRRGYKQSAPELAAVSAHTLSSAESAHRVYGLDRRLCLYGACSSRARSLSPSLEQALAHAIFIPSDVPAHNSSRALKGCQQHYS